MNFFKNYNLSLFFVRVTLGVMVIMHGIAKIINGLTYIKTLLLKNSLPEFIAYFVYLGEIVAPLFLILGIFSRYASIAIILNVIAIFYLTSPDMLSLTRAGGFSLEILYFYLGLSISIVFSGSGKYAIKSD